MNKSENEVPHAELPKSLLMVDHSSRPHQGQKTTQY
jgi:hypothetical protein